MLVLRKKDIFIVFIVVLILFTNHFFSYIKWNSTFSGRISYFIYSIPFILYFINRDSLNRGDLNFQVLVSALIIIPFFSGISSYFEYNQSPIDSFKAAIPGFLWLLYFILHRYKIEEKTILFLITGFVIITFSIQLIQQLNIGIARFGLVSLDGTLNNLDKRNGLYRFRLGDNGFYAMLLLFFYWSNLSNVKKNTKYIFIWIALISIYLTLTRQIWITTLFTLLVSIFILRNRRLKFWVILLVSVLAIVLVNYWEELFGQMIKETEKQLSTKFIRFFTYEFYWEKIGNSSLTFIIGAGRPGSNSEFEQLFSYWQDKLRMYTSDIGLIGQWFHYGVIYIIFYLNLLYKILIKFRNEIPLYIVLFALATMIISPMIYPYANPFYYILWCLILYICDLHINRSSLRLNFD